MDSLNLQILLFAYMGFTCTCAIAALLQGSSKKTAILIALLSILGMVMVFKVAELEQPGTNFLIDTLTRLSNLSRTDLTALLFGTAAALPVSIILFELSKKRARAKNIISVMLVLAVAGVLLGGGGFVAKKLLSPYLPNPNSTTGVVGVGKLAADGFSIQDFANTDIIPVRVAVSPSGKLFVSGHWGIAAQEGVVAELISNADGTVTEKLVARMLNRPYGLLATDDEIIVSRSGQYTKWSNGSAEQISTGAVTRLRDLDGDGIMDWYDDIVDNLPGAKGPDYLHQNNDLALGPDGTLYITTANHSDGHPASHEQEGAILQVSGENYDSVTVYANGLRNPFGMSFDGAGNLFATDNDSQSGKLGGNLGDKLLEVKQGAFYGHPFAKDDEPGVTAPLMRSPFALGGLAYAAKGSLPSPWDDSLYVVIYGEGRIARVDISEDASGQKTAKLVLLATIPGAVDIDISNAGEFYIGVYPDKIVKILSSKNTQSAQLKAK